MKKKSFLVLKYEKVKLYIRIIKYLFLHPSMCIHPKKTLQPQTCTTWDCNEIILKYFKSNCGTLTVC